MMEVMWNIFNGCEHFFYNFTIIMAQFQLSARAKSFQPIGEAECHDWYKSWFERNSVFTLIYLHKSTYIERTLVYMNQIN